MKPAKFIFCYFENKYLQFCKYLLPIVVKLAKKKLYVFFVNMINFSNIKNNINFNGTSKHKQQSKVTQSTHTTFSPRILLSTVGLALCLNSASPMSNDVFEKQDTIEVVDDMLKPRNKTQLSSEELLAAPSPLVNIAGEEKKVGIVVDTKTNKLYRYDDSGEVIDGYHVATGKLKSNGKSLTTPGIRRVHHIEDYPYSKAYGTKRKANPKAYGPNILYLTIINPKTGKEEGSNGEFIHGNNNPSSIGKYASHGCMRMDNDIIKQFADEVEVGTLVLIK